MESVGVRGGESCQSSEGLAGAQTDLPTHSLWSKCWSNATGQKPRAREVGKASHPLRLQPFLIRHLQLQNNLRSLRFLSTCTLESYKQILCSRRRSSYLTALKKQKQTQQQRKLNRQVLSQVVGWPLCRQVGDGWALLSGRLAVCPVFRCVLIVSFEGV